MFSYESLLFGLITALIGYIIGNRLAIGRDRRKEFNDLINPIRTDLLSIKIFPANNLRGMWIITLSLIREKLPVWKRKGFDRAIEAYKQSKSEYSRNRKSDGMGGFVDGEKSAENKSAISHAADNLLKYLKPR